MSKRGQTAERLRALRKKFGLGEFRKPGAKSSRRKGRSAQKTPRRATSEASTVTKTPRRAGGRRRAGGGGGRRFGSNLTFAGSNDMPVQDAGSGITPAPFTSPWTGKTYSSFGEYIEAEHGGVAGPGAGAG